MTIRQAFESHIAKTKGEKPFMVNGVYNNVRWRQDWELWQACARAALEEAAKVCELQRCSDFDNYGRGYDSAAWNCADAIRLIEVE